MDTRLSLLEGKRVGHLRDQELSNLASAIVAYWEGRAQVGVTHVRGNPLVRFTGSQTDVTVLKSDWEVIEPKILDGTLTYQNSPAHTKEEYVLNVLKILFTDTYPTSNV
jgi:hypothetical protein